MGLRDELEAKLRGREQAVATSRLGRLWKTGRSAAGLAGSVLRRGADVDLASLTALTTRLGELKGVGMKLGQILSFIDPSMPPEVRELLSVLQRSAPASPREAVEATLRQAFGARAAVLLAAMAPQPFSVASIGQVHRARLEGFGELVVKVRHPGIEAALSADFGNALGGVSVANAVLLGMASDAKGMVEEGRATMLAECDFAREATHQRAFRAWLSARGGVVVPEVIEAWSSAAVLTSRYEPGETLEAWLDTSPSPAQRDRFGRALFEVMVGGFHELGLLYADPHPGNFAFRGEQVVVYDFGCVRAFSREQSQAFAAMAAALADGDRAALLTAARRFGFRVEGEEREALLERFARSFFAPMLVRGANVIPPEGAIEAAQLIRDKRALAKLGLPPPLLFLLRLRFGLYAVLSKLGARADWGQLEREAAERGKSAPRAGAA